MLACLAYYSLRANAASRAEDLAILQTALEMNKTFGITGCLLTTETEFFQYIEGEEAPLLSLLENLQADARHRVQLVTPPQGLGQRRFHDWSMGYAALPSGHQLMNYYITAEGALPLGDFTDAIKAKLTVFRTLSRIRVETEKWRNLKPIIESQIDVARRLRATDPDG